jgi:glycosyltransferase involved in cell wall biosynthesis
MRVKKKRKILHIISSLENGGAQAVLSTIIGQTGARYEHHVIYFHDGLYKHKLEELGARVYQVRGILCLYDPFFFIRLLMLVHALRPDSIHAVLWAATVCARIAGAILQIPVVLAIHGQVPVEYAGASRAFITKLVTKLTDFYARASRLFWRSPLNSGSRTGQAFEKPGFSCTLVAVSGAVRDSLIAHKFAPASADSIQVIRNGVDVSQIVAAGARAGLRRADIGCNQDHMVFGAVGRLVPVKNYGLLIKAFAHVVAQFPLARLVIIGSGPEQPALESLIDLYNLQETVLLCGQQNACGYYPLFDCFVQPSAQEGLSIALLEALCFGLPALVTGAGGAHDIIIDGKHGIVVEPNNQIVLMSGMLRIAFDATFRVACADECAALVRNTGGAAPMVERYAALFDGEPTRGENISAR